MSVTYGLDPKSQRISVYYTESSTIYEGMPVCYEFDATANWLGVNGATIDFATTASTITEGATTAEGYGNEGKFIRVEDPDADNIHAFAGVVAGKKHEGKAGPGVIDIYVPNGAIVPVRTDQNCTVGRTVLAVHTAEQHLTGPYGTAGRPVAVAWETLDNSSAAATVLAKLDPNLFISQKADAVDLLVDDQDTGNELRLNQINVDFASATGDCMALSVVATSSAGAASNGYGLAGYFEADIEAATAAHTAGVGIWMNITGGTQTKNLCALEVGLYESGANLTGAGSFIAPLVLRTQLDGTNGPAANKHYMTYYKVDGADKPDGLFMTYTPDSIGLAAKSSAAVSHIIPIHVQVTGGGIAAGTYYIMVSDTA